MKVGRKVFVLVLLSLILLGMGSCINNIPCPAYASTTLKAQNNRS